MEPRPATNREEDGAAMSRRPLEPLAGAAPEELSWLTGYWSGRHDTDVTEEVWSPPEGEGLVGTFRWLAGGVVRFYEILTLTAENGTVVLRVKHFDRALSGWEEKDACVAFDLVSHENREAAFLMRDRPAACWLVYRREGEDLAAWFEKEGGGADPSARFRWRRRPL